MSGRIEPRKTEVIENVTEFVRERLDTARVSGAEHFVRLFYEHAPTADLEEISSDDLYGAAISFWGFAQHREPGKPAIRVFNPSVAEHGWRSRHSVVEIVNDDMPFLVDSVTSELHRREAEVQLLIHPVVRLQRDAAGDLVELIDSDAPPEEGTRESLMQVHISEQADSKLDEIAAALSNVLADVRVAVTDWPAMNDACKALLEELESNPPNLPGEQVEEGLAFLRWLQDDHFTFLGYREYDFHGAGADAVARIRPNCGLGILRDPERTVFDGLRNLGQLPDEVRAFVRQPDLLRVTKSNVRSTVHRPVHLDTVAVKRMDAQGRVLGERLIVGLFTAVAYSYSPREVPLLRRKVDDVLRRASFDTGSHYEKTLLHVLDTYPRDELFQMQPEELATTLLGIVDLQERQRVKMFHRVDPFERFVSVLVYVPRDRYDTRLRLRFQDILARAFAGAVSAYYTRLTDEPLARLHIYIKTRPGEIPKVDDGALEAQLQETARSWEDRLNVALVEDRGEQRGLETLRRFGGAFPGSYQDQFGAAAAVEDIAQIEAALESGGLSMSLYRPLEARPHQMRFKTYSGGEAAALSDVVPMLENMGLRVIGETPYRVRTEGDHGHFWIRDFDVESRDGVAVDVGAVRATFHDAFGQVSRGDLEDDGFNRLVLAAGLTAREVTVLRTYCKYLRQVVIPFSQAYMEDTLARNPRFPRLLVDLFGARFDPEGRDDERAARIVHEVEARLEQVSNLDEDRILRRFLDVIVGTLRTNYYQTDEEGRPKPYLAVKLDSRKLIDLPEPRPVREVFVYSPRVEAIHLRGGLVARGGIRWSDRREDFRTEVLGLMKAQMVKNAVIVPVGSKGGFVVKRPPEGDREALMEEVRECYRTLMRGLLDLTDNLDGDAVVPPPNVVRHDGDDTYLVVAADKGTATFSDIANGISQEYGYWLDDAFASGGSAGYDHKIMGITARGAWECVKRHFRELGKDIQTEEFTVVGVGDMSGDVFGNGMLLSEQTKLLAAFNHLHIFIDPDPDPAASLAERRRLFDLPRSSWDDYDRALISEGGGVIDRSAKSVELTPRMKELFEIENDHVTPAELIQAILRADVELLWLGGIGTYVKAPAESHADVGDHANDALRIDATEVRAQVVGEGANLGFTQRGRIEFALRGGRLNTDALDNSAGVDCSDHEVNIKILLGEVERAGDITRKQRNQLLVSMTDEVGDLVLLDNYLQSQTISVTHNLGAHLLDRIARFMRALEKAGRLDRRIEFLPDDDALSERLTKRQGFTRPELAVLLAYAKIAVFEDLLASPFPDDPYLAHELPRYFPRPLREGFSEAITHHRLRREIICTTVTNEMLNRMGITFVHEVREKTGMPVSDIAAAYLVCRSVSGMRGLWRVIEGLDSKVPSALQATLLTECGRLMERVIVWLLREVGSPIDITKRIDMFGPGIHEVVDQFEDLLTDRHKAALAERAAGYVEQGAPPDVARRVARMHFMAPTGDIVRIAHQAEAPVTRVGMLYFAIGVRFGFEYLRRAAARLPSDTAWNKLAVGAIVDDLFGQQRELTARVLGAADPEADTEEMIHSWEEQRLPLVTRTDQLLAELHSVTRPDLAMLAVAGRQLKSMAMA